MLNHYKSYALAYTLAPNLLQYRLQLTNGMPLSDYNKLLTVCILPFPIDLLHRPYNSVHTAEQRCDQSCSGQVTHACLAGQLNRNFNFSGNTQLFHVNWTPINKQRMPPVDRQEL